MDFRSSTRLLAAAHALRPWYAPSIAGPLQVARDLLVPADQMTGLGPGSARSATPRWRSALGSAATFLLVLVGVSAIGHVIRSALPSSRVQQRSPQTVISERRRIKVGQAIRYELVLVEDGRLKIDVRSAPVPVTVKLVPIEESRSNEKRSKNPERSPSGSPPVFLQPDALTVITVESLTAGKWEILIERSDRSVATRKTETAVTTEVTAL